MKVVMRALLVILLLGVLASIAAVFYLRLSLPQTSGTLVLPGLRAEVEIVRDRYGVPHIFAQNSADANFALGFVHAQDRLWQMEMNRRIAAGRLAEIVGEAALASDKFLRTLGIARQAAATFEHLDDEARAALSAYAAGVNAFLEQRSGPLPVEFVLLGVVPELWTAVDSLSWVKMMAWDLSGNWRQELLRASLAKKLSAQQIEDFLAPRYEADGTWTADQPVVVRPGIEAGQSAAAPEKSPAEPEQIRSPEGLPAQPEQPRGRPEQPQAGPTEPELSRPESEQTEPDSSSPETRQLPSEPDQPAVAPSAPSQAAPEQPAPEQTVPEPRISPQPAGPESTSEPEPPPAINPQNEQPGAGKAEPQREPAQAEPPQAEPPPRSPIVPGQSALEEFGASPQSFDSESEPPEPASDRLRPISASALKRLPPSIPPDLRALYATLGATFAQLAVLAPPALPEGAGSNNWAVDGRFSASGKPLLANDPHLALTAPSVWYFAHLQTPALNVIGATLPGVPAVVLGRNNRIAWSFTNTSPDVQDLFLEKLDGADPRRYLTPQGPREFLTRTETIKIRDAPDVVLTIRESRHGPIISDLIAAPTEAGHVLAFAWTALADDDLSFQASVKLAGAENWGQFVAALRDFHSPQQNVVYADVDGNIGFLAPGRVPVRKADNDLQGRMPAPGWDARYDWDGFIPFEQLPRSFNPAGGRIVTANNKIIADDYPHLITDDWAAPYRARRIGELLAASERHTPAGFAAIQGDITSPMMAQFLPLLLAAPVQNAETASALQLLNGWHGEMRADQPQPLIVAAWLRELSRLIYADELGELFDGAWEQRPLFLFNVLTDRDGQGRWCDNVTTPAREDCNQQIGAALALALADLRQRYGGNMLRWRWGDAHVAEAGHRPFSRHALLGRLFDLRTPTSGDTYSINVGRYAIGDDREPYANRHAATLRAIYDLANLDHSLFIQATGESGNRLSPHYADLVERWAAVDYLPMTTKRSEIDAGATGTLRLQPAP